MDCDLMEELFVAHALGACEGEERDFADEHLATCPKCLRAYLALKRHVDEGARGKADAPRPSPAARARLRAEVAAAFAPTLMTRLRGAFARPIPLYQGAFVALVLVVVAAVVPLALAPRSMRASDAGRVDTARQSPESLNVY